MLVNLSGAKRGSGGRKRVDAETAFVGIILVMRYGLPWWLLDHLTGHSAAIYRRFRLWSVHFLPQLFERSLLRKAWRGPVCVDSTDLKCGHDSLKHKAREEQSIGRSKGGWTSKLHIVTGAGGHILNYRFSPGNQTDISHLLPLLKHHRPSHLMADKAYSSRELVSSLKKRRITAVIPSRSNERFQRPLDKPRYRTRHLVENAFCRLKRSRRPALRSDSLLSVFTGFVLLAVISFNFSLSV